MGQIPLRLDVLYEFGGYGCPYPPSSLAFVFYLKVVVALSAVVVAASQATVLETVVLSCRGIGRFAPTSRSALCRRARRARRV